MCISGPSLLIESTDSVIVLCACTQSVYLKITEMNNIVYKPWYEKQHFHQTLWRDHDHRRTSAHALQLYIQDHVILTCMVM